MSNIEKCWCLFCNTQLLGSEDQIRRHLTSEHGMKIIPGDIINRILNNFSSSFKEIPNLKKGIEATQQPVRAEIPSLVLVTCDVCKQLVSRKKYNKHITKLHHGRTDENEKRLYALTKKCIKCSICKIQLKIDSIIEHYKTVHKKPAPRNNSPFSLNMKSK